MADEQEAAEEARRLGVLKGGSGEGALRSIELYKIVLL